MLHTTPLTCEFIYDETRLLNTFLNIFEKSVCSNRSVIDKFVTNLKLKQIFYDIESYYLRFSRLSVLIRVHFISTLRTPFTSKPETMK